MSVFPRVVSETVRLNLDAHHTTPTPTSLKGKRVPDDHFNMVRALLEMGTMREPDCWLMHDYVRSLPCVRYHGLLLLKN